MAGFCIDELSFWHVADLPIVISRLNDQLSTIHDQHHQQVHRSSELDYIQVLDGVDFCDLLYNGELGLIDQDERLLLQQTINRCIVWDAENFDLPDGEILFNDNQAACASIMFIVTKALAGESMGIISQLPPKGVGVCNASVDRASTCVFHVGLDTRLDQFYRFQICFEKVSREDFGKWVHLSFPRLRFALEISSQLRRFRQNFDDIRDIVVGHLASVNDEFLDLLVAGAQLPDACDRIRSTCGVSISPESPNTHRNAIAMREREVQFRGNKIVCEFHTKLTPTHDRIHFSPTVRSEADDSKYIVVGPFAEHLTT